MFLVVERDHTRVEDDGKEVQNIGCSERLMSKVTAGCLRSDILVGCIDDTFNEIVRKKVVAEIHRSRRSKIAAVGSWELKTNLRLLRFRE